jgi:hypothetical protein
MHATIEGARSKDDPRTFVFDVGGDVPVVRVQVDLPGGNRVV